ncbi:MAG: pyroglutamyl-peptidase I family protein [Phycisphaerales bacterium]
MRVLITGFEPFEGSPTNCTAMVVARIGSLLRDGRGHALAEREVATAVLPVADRTAAEALDSAMRAHRPEVIVCLGEASGRSSVGIERVAINLRDYRIPDNEGAVVSDRPIVADGPAAYFATLPLRSMGAAFERRGIASRISRDAGTFLCNQVMYEALHRVRGTPALAGFVHLPLVREQIGEIADGRRSMPRLGAGVFDAVASDGSMAERGGGAGPDLSGWIGTLTREAPTLEAMSLGVMDAVEAACSAGAADE